MADVTLLVGENGTGKSTVLYALAGLLAGIDGKSEESAPIRARLHAETNESVLRLNTSRGPIEATGLSVRTQGAAGSPVKHLLQQPLGVRGRQWTALAYAGMRGVTNVGVTALQELTNDPEENALSFSKSVDAQVFAQWLANMNLFRLQSATAPATNGRVYDRSIEAVEAALTTVLGEDLAFVFPAGSVDVKVRLRGRELAFEVLPDGLKSILSWLGDLHMRMSRVRWVNDLPLREREFLLLLDEVDVHLHPAWQRRVLPLVQKLFPRAQIVATTHSPLVVASAADARVIVLRRDQPPVDLDAQVGKSYSAVLRAVFDVDSEFDPHTEEQLQELHQLKNALIARRLTDRTRFDELARELGGRSEELGQIVAYEKRQLDRQLSA